MALNAFEQAKSEAAQAGYVISPRDLENVAALQTAERKRLTELGQTNVSRGWVVRFNDTYPRLLEGMLGLGDILLTLVQTLILAPGALLLLLIVEQQRVVHGIALFETDPGLATFAAWALVILNLVLEFQIHYVEHRANYEPKRATQFSLKTWWQYVRYFVGWGHDWQAVELSPAQRYRRILRLVTFSILILALAGSMRKVIAQTPGAWYVGIKAVMIESDLLTMFVWVGGLLFASAAVLAAQALSRYVTLRCVEIVASMKARYPAAQSGELGGTPALDDIAAQYIRARIVEKQVRQGNRSGRTQSPLASQEVELPDNIPFGTILPTLDGLGSTRPMPSANGHTADAKS